MLDTIKEFRLRYGLNQTALGEALGMSQRWVSDRDELEPAKREPMVNLALERLEQKFRRQKESAEIEVVVPCPECGAPMKPRNWYLKDWYYRQLNACRFCKGSSDKPHRRVAMGLLDTGQWHRLDRVVNPRTKQETHLRKRKRVTDYERDNDFVWCDLTSGRDGGCGGICTPAGLHSFHGTEYHVFRCFNPECKKFYRRRLYCREGKCFEARTLPSDARHSSLPEEARRCFYCKGRTESRGRRNAPPNCIQLHCTACGKISYFDEVSRKCLPGRRPGGNFREDPLRSKCKKCGKRKNWLRRFTKSVLERRPTLVPIAVRLRLARRPRLRQLFREAKARDVVLVNSSCRHREIYKSADGREVWRRRSNQKLPRGRNLNYSVAHREGRPIKRTKKI